MNHPRTSRTTQNLVISKKVGFVKLGQQKRRSDDGHFSPPQQQLLWGYEDYRYSTYYYYLLRRTTMDMHAYCMAVHNYARRTNSKYGSISSLSSFLFFWFTTVVYWYTRYIDAFFSSSLLLVLIGSNTE